MSPQPLAESLAALRQEHSIHELLETLAQQYRAGLRQHNSPARKAADHWLAASLEFMSAGYRRRLKDAAEA